ncbi:MAG: CGNR zinc finger domain-containing protein [Actinomycetota bacterium]|nr:CGNR zinc finger domain-containing protein [Actinomycetota bacterium]
MAVYPSTWLERRGREPASDLDLVVLLLNSLDLVADPPDRLTRIDWYREVLSELGHDDIAMALRPEDLAGLRELRETLRGVFEADSEAGAAAILNPMLARVPAVPQLVLDADTVELRVSPRERGLRALEARLPAALAAHVAERGLSRLGTCAAHPCRCGFIDHTRGRTRRFCCTQCNDRAAAKQYRRRKIKPRSSAA